MRWSIRNQILIPLVAIQAAAATAAAVAAAGLAARRTETAIVGRLNDVIETLGRANFPLTGDVLARMRGLAGAHFIAYSEDGRVVAATLPGLTELPPALRDAPQESRLETLGGSPSVELGGERYLAVPLGSTGQPRAASLLVLYPESSWLRARWEAAAPSLALGLASIGLLATFTGWVAQRISTRVRRLNDQVARIAEGRFVELELGGGRDEVDELSRSINRMSLQLRDMQRTIARTERARLLAQLGAGLAHQMRNSLTGARMSIQLHARRNPAAAAAGDRSLEVALRQLAMTEEQVKGLLTLGRAESGPATLCDLSRLAGDIALLVGPAGEHARVALEVRAGGAPIEATVEEPAVRGAVLNLVLNAIEAAGPGGSVRLEAFDDGASVGVEVVDDGPGPPEEVADTLFEPFATSKPEGVGLGLALAHQVAARHGGRLDWRRVDGETRFRLSLPRQAAGATTDLESPPASVVKERAE